MKRDPLGANYWRLVASSVAANLGDGMIRTALPLLAVTLTRDPFLIGALSALAFLPWLLFAIPAGAIVDRMDRRRAMIVANSGRAVVVGVLVVAIAMDRASLPLLYGIAFALGVGETVYETASRAMLPQVVRRDQLDRANGPLTSAEIVSQTFLAAPIGSVLFAWLVLAPFLGTLAGLLAGVALLASITGNLRSVRASAEPTTLRTEMAEGLRWLLGHRLLRGLAVVSGLTAAAATMADSLLVLYVVDHLGVPEQAFGLFLVAAGVGGLLGGLTAARLSARFGRIATMVGCSLANGAAAMGMGLTDLPWLGAVLFGVIGFSVSAWNVLIMSLRQALVPSPLFGRVQGAYRTVLWGLIPVGALLGGLVAGLTDVTTTYVISGGLLIILALAMGRLMAGHRDQIDRAHDPSPESAPSGRGS